MRFIGRAIAWMIVALVALLLLWGIAAALSGIAHLLP